MSGFALKPTTKMVKIPRFDYSASLSRLALPPFFFINFPKIIIFPPEAEVSAPKLKTKN
jgi:hypothetical protein